MKIVCDACSAKYSIADEKVRGKVFKIRCKKCSNIIVVRGSASDDGPQQFDQKETKVFDYAGYDSPSAAVAAAGAEEAVWHVVIDQEQVGPMTVQEVGDRFARGDIDADTYIWKEGFADWERIATLEPFAHLTGGGPAADAGGMFAGDVGAAAMFGSAVDGDDGGLQSDPADLFAAQLGGAPAADDEPGADLFSGSSLRGGGGLAPPAASGDYADDGGLFAASGNGASAHAAAAAAGGGVSPLTGQRNENSVLFSLNNLASLASDAPRSHTPIATSTPSSASASGGMSAASGPVTEGSGLIDIRAMAQVYLGDERPAPVSRHGSADDLPVFSAPSFDSAAPVLLPQASPVASNKLMIALIGAIGILALVAVVLAVIVLRGGDDKSSSGSNAVASLDEQPTPTAGSATAAGKPTNDQATEPTEGTTGTTGEPPAAGTDTGAVPPSTGTTTPSAAAVKKDDKRSDRSSRDEKKDRDKEKKPEKVAAAADSPVPSSVQKSTSGGGGCDELDCLVDPDKACCKKGGKKPTGSSRTPTTSAGSSDLPERLSRDDISNGIGRVRGRVAACGDKHGFQGKVTVNIKISAGGSVSSAVASGANGAVHSCVSSAVKGASFRKTQKGMSVRYPFVIR